MSAGLSLRYTHDFVRASLPADAKTILEIGCGTGELARLLQHDGFEVIAIDSDPEAIATARDNGVDARVASWPAEIGQQFDAVLFTRSLHHIHDLAPAIAAAVDTLRPGGRIIVEDFRAEGGGERGDAWFDALVRKLNSSGVLRSDADVDAILERARPAEHEEELHPSTAIDRALRRHGSVESGDAAYYFRYLEPDLMSASDADALLDKELQRIASAEIDALGKRYVLSPVS